MRSSHSLGAVAISGLLCLILAGAVQRAGARQAAQPLGNWADWIEPDFPFFSSVVDARRAGSELSARNLTPRGLVLKIGRDQWLAFDVDLLRVAAIWRGTAVTPVALAPGSYNHPDRKTPGGQSPLPEPAGKVWLANGIYAGWQAGAQLSLDDPREPAPSPEEVGRGPLSEDMGRFKAIRMVGDGVVLEYTAGGSDVAERTTASEAGAAWNVIRQFRVGPATRQLWLVLGAAATETRVALAQVGAAPVREGVSLERYAQNGGTVAEKPAAGAPPVLWAVRVAPHEEAIEFGVWFCSGSTTPSAAPSLIPSAAPASRWPQEVTTAITKSSARDAYVVDDIALPLDNPWRRSVRPGDIQFLADGTAAVVTLDGDVWLARGLHNGGAVRWRRFASGLHEPLTLAVRDGQVYVFDRNGIWRLRDTNGDGEADVHELFSNAFAQTADMREFPNTVRLAPGGEFVIAKGGQEAATLGKHNGSVLRVSADGRRSTVLGYGFRQPNIGVNLQTGLVTATDQQGNYIPSTPLHIVRDKQFYGFLSEKRPREVYPAPIADPLTWVPHTANASAMSQVWLSGARMGPLNDALVYFGFNGPELFRVLLDNRGARQQAAVVSVTRAFDFPPLNGSVDPADGQLYVAGFQILGWGTTATRLAGLGRIRYTGAPSTLPREIAAMDKGVLLRFDEPLEAATAVDPDNYSLATWHYKRTYQYGSPQFKADATPGIDRLAPSSAYLSADKRAVFIGVPGMKPVMQMRVVWSLATSTGVRFQDTAYLTPYDLTPFKPAAEGFRDIAVDLTPRAAAVNAAAPVSVEEGRRLYQAYGCVACHAVDDTSLTKLGPAWKGLYGSSRTVAGGVVRVVADEAYLRESILQPAAKVVSGYERGDVSMPSYSGVLNASQIESLILFIKSLR